VHCERAIIKLDEFDNAAAGTDFFVGTDNLVFFFVGTDNLVDTNLTVWRRRTRAAWDCE
jgi:hypothetical protein